jgi:hypothetical protein
MRTVKRVVVLVAIFVLALAPAAPAAIDYSMNSVGGDYSPAVTPTVSEPTGTVDSGFDWGAAAIGAGAALVVIVTATGLRSGVGVMRSRREPA